MDRGVGAVHVVEGSGRNFVEGLNSDYGLSFGRFGSFGLQDVLCGFGTWRGRFFLISREDAEPPSFAKKTLDSACCASRVGSLGVPLGAKRLVVFAAWGLGVGVFFDFTRRR